MSALSAEQLADDAPSSADPDAAGAGSAALAVDRLETAAPPADRGFWGAFAAAAALHALLLLGTFTASPRQIGDADGSADGISVSVVTEADLRGQSTPPEPPPGQPSPAAAKPTPPAPEPVPQQPPQQEAAATPPPPSEPAPEPLPDLKPSQLPDVEPAPKPEAEKAVEAALEKDLPDLLTLPTATAKPPKKETAAQPKKADAAPKPQAPQQPQQKRVAKLDLTPPSPSMSAPSGNFGRRAGMERPPGITRSGANDEFARGVIRALQGTMPQLREVLGRVTVRITLNENGNVTDVQVVRTANNSTIDQSVVFAAKQTSYPFPPPNSNMADRTFLVTYIYH